MDTLVGVAGTDILLPCHATGSPEPQVNNRRGIVTDTLLLYIQEKA